MEPPGWRQDLRDVQSYAELGAAAKWQKLVQGRERTAVRWHRGSPEVGGQDTRRVPCSVLPIPALSISYLSICFHYQTQGSEFEAGHGNWRYKDKPKPVSLIYLFIS